MWEAYAFRDGLACVRSYTVRVNLFGIVFKDYRVMVLVMRNKLENFLTVVGDVRLTKEAYGMQRELGLGYF